MSMSLKRTGRDHDRGVVILPPTTAEEHIVMDDARDIWNVVKARFGRNAESNKMRKSMLKQEFLEFRIGKVEGLHKGYDRMQKILSQLNQLKAKPDVENINLKFLRALPLSWPQVALTLKTKGPSHSAFVSATSASKKISYEDSLNYSKEFGMIVGCDTEDEIKEGAAKIYNLITGADTKEANTAGDAGEFALMGVTSEAKNIIKDVHEGSCGMHSGPRSVVSKISRLGYYWPSMHKDVKELIQKCKAFQIYSSVPRKPKQEMISIMSAWPFSQWGIDIVDPLPTTLRGERFLVVAIDYTKWVEAKPLISTTRKHIEKFV
uniref:Reverse transcriptase domain-containing protein n=1 Tax=Tanacetum cinerariifolium TaxID=118510 RepID=A0A6L2MFC3_TANCI|nr:reverse transcriptase domain-containing protein [Tanacetum cinerariifolium]